jgi:hypothetical protein
MAKSVTGELLAIQSRSKDSMLHPSEVVSWAAEHPKSALYPKFEWDDSRAGHEWRLQQARSLIRLHVVTEDGTPKLVNLRIDRSKGGGYREIKDVMNDEDLRTAMLADCVADIKRVQARYSFIKNMMRGLDRETEKLERLLEQRKKKNAA